MALELDPLLAPLVQGHTFEPPGDVVEERARELVTARSSLGVLVKPAPASVRFEDRSIGGPDPDAPVTVRVYHPGTEGTRAGLLFFHGGGWSTGSIETAHAHCANLSADADVVVVSVEYRLAPEHPYPAGLDDCYHALRWAAADAEQLGIDAARIAVGGASAGANLAAAVALKARDERGPALVLQLLEIPVLDLTLGSPSAREVAEVYPELGKVGGSLTRRYLDKGTDLHDPYISPLLADDLTGLPPAVLLACEIDPVRDDAARYAERLEAAGVPARSEIYKGLVHGTQELTMALPAAMRWQEECAAVLRGI
ncbi:alpha/beta hydrolase [Streptomyces nodosus]